MSEPARLNSHIVERLYCEALVLSDEVRSAFALSGRIEDAGTQEDLARVALSCEALRTTTRMMHATAWLLNHRAFFMGELSEFQLRRYGSLAADLPGSDPGHLELLDSEVCALVEETERFYARLLRLDRSWRQPDPRQPSAIERLRARLANQL